MSAAASSAVTKSCSRRTRGVAEMVSRRGTLGSGAGPAVLDASSTPSVTHASRLRAASRPGTAAASCRRCLSYATRRGRVPDAPRTAPPPPPRALLGVSPLRLGERRRAGGEGVARAGARGAVPCPGSPRPPGAHPGQEGEGATGGAAGRPAGLPRRIEERRGASERPGGGVRGGGRVEQVARQRARRQRGMRSPCRAASASALAPQRPLGAVASPVAAERALEGLGAGVRGRVCGARAELGAAPRTAALHPRWVGVALSVGRPVPAVALSVWRPAGAEVQEARTAATGQHGLGAAAGAGDEARTLLQLALLAAGHLARGRTVLQHKGRIGGALTRVCPDRARIAARQGAGCSR